MSHRRGAEPSNDRRDTREKEYHPNMDVNIYATRKTVAQGMMDIALLTANASQLKYVLNQAEQHEHYLITITLLSMSIVLQIVVGILLVFVGRWNINRRKEQKKAELANNVVVIMIFLITVVNVLVSAFSDGSDNPRGKEKETEWQSVYGHNGYLEREIELRKCAALNSWGNCTVIRR